MSPNRSNKTENTLVSVIIPHYEAEEYLSEAVESALNQEYRPIEIVIVDSSDSTVAQSLAAQHEEIVYESREPDGVAAARNRAIELSSGAYIALLDADDYWLPGKLETTVRALSDADVVYSDMYVLEDGKKEYYETRQYDDHIEYFAAGGSGIPSRTVVASRYVFDDWMFNEELYSREDPNLWTKLLSKYEFEYIPEPTGVKRIREGSLTDGNQARHRQSELDSIDDLVATFPELQPYAKSRRSPLLERLAVAQFHAGNYRQSFESVFGCLRSGRFTPRVIAVFTCLFLPRGNTIYNRFSKIYRKL